MKKLICLCALSLISVQAMATAACAGTAGNVTIAGSDSADAFIKTTFNTTCSNNVLVDYDQSANAAWGSSGSNKGACYQIGHTDAGVRAKTSTCGAAAREINGTAEPSAADAENMGSSS